VTRLGGYGLFAVEPDGSLNAVGDLPALEKDRNAEVRGLHEIRLLSNNPDKRNRLAKAGIAIVEMVPTEVPSRDENVRYLRTKKDRMDHLLLLDTASAFLPMR
jgi:hypothetical protein